jgi:hypothetical protein
MEIKQISPHIIPGSLDPNRDFMSTGDYVYAELI